MSACSNCAHSRSAHHTANGWTHCVLCACEQPVGDTQLSVREAARRYAAERGCGREKAVALLDEDEVLLLTALLHEAHEGKGQALTSFEKLNKKLDVERLAEKLGVDL